MDIRVWETPIMKKCEEIDRSVMIEKVSGHPLRSRRSSIDRIATGT